MEVKWQVDDGYAGGARPKYTTVPDDELAECETDEARQELISQYIQEDFEQNISWSCDIGKAVSEWHKEHDPD